MNTIALRSLEYQNDFFSLVIREAPDRGPNSYIYSSGINISRFDPLCWGKTGICSNPAFKGLQQLRADVSGFALERGMVTKNAGPPSSAVSVTARGHGWYREDDLLIEDASPEDVQEILEFCVTDLVKTVLTVCFPDIMTPGYVDPGTLQSFLESLYVPNYKQAAPPPIAKRYDETRLIVREIVRVGAATK